MAHLNCWEFYHCPEERHLACSAFTQGAGRRCWLVAGTLCGGKVQSAFAKMIGGCQKCDFYLQVKSKQV
jgi:hypothetical protein